MVRKTNIMNRPYLQLALDCLTLEDAIDACEKIGNEVDILEAGTLLCAVCGMEGLKAVRTMFPDKIIVTDLKITDAAEKLCHLVFENKTNWTTINAAADIETVKAGVEVANEFGGEIQIELFGDYDEDKVKAWRNLGINQVIYHKPRESKSGWGQADLDHVAWLNSLGMEVSVTGGVNVQNIHLFQSLNIKTFIIGRAILAADDPKAEVHQFITEINKYWG